MTRKQYAKLWSDDRYEARVRELAYLLNSDGCTGVPDFYKLGCLEHDIAYRTHRDPSGQPISRAEADRRFRWYIQLNSPFGRLSPMSWWRWAAVRIFGKWTRNPEPFVFDLTQ